MPIMVSTMSPNMCKLCPRSIHLAKGAPPPLHSPAAINYAWPYRLSHDTRKPPPKSRRVGTLAAPVFVPTQRYATLGGHRMTFSPGCAIIPPRKPQGGRDGRLYSLLQRSVDASWRGYDRPYGPRLLCGRHGIRGRQDLQRQELPAQGAYRPPVPLPALRSHRPGALTPGDVRHQRRGGPAQHAAAGRGWRFHHLPVRHPRQGPSRLAGRRPGGVRQDNPNRLLVWRCSRRRPARRYHQDNELLSGGPRPQDQTLQPHELQPGRDRGQRHGRRRVADTPRRGGATSPRAQATTCS